jgi:predicted permease
MLPMRSVWLLAWRGVLRHRRANAAIAATLAVLAAVLIAMMSLGYNLLVAPWTYDSDRFGVLRHGVPGTGQERYGFSAGEFRILRDSGVFESISASQGVPVAYGDGSGAAQSMTMIRTTPSALAVSDAQPLIGRFVSPGEPGSERRIVISHSVWQRDFDMRADVLGKSLLLDGMPYEIVGVMPRRFFFMGGDFWTAHAADLDSETSPEQTFVLNFKLPRGTRVADVEPRIDAVAATFPARSDTARYPRGWRIMPMRVIDAVTGPQRPAVLLVLAGAATLLLLGILNVAALLVARQIADAGMVATRKALGESRALGLGVVFVESLIIAVASLLAAMLLGRLLFDGFIGMIAVEWVPRELEGAFRYATPALWLLPVIAVLIAVTLTLIRLPALLRIDTRQVIAGSTRNGGGRGDVRTTRWLSGLQIAIAATILVSSFAIGSGAKALLSRDIGIDTGATQHTTLTFPRERYADAGQRIAAMDRFAEILRREGAQAVGYTDAAPMQRYTRSGVLSAASGAALDDALQVDYHAAHGDIAGALALRIREGRFIDSSRDHADAEPVAVITRSLAQQLAPGGSALGATIDVAGGSDAPVPRRVVGVIDDVRHESPLSPVRPKVYVPYAQDPSIAGGSGGRTSLLIRWPTAGSMPGIGRIAELLGSVDPWIAVREVTTMQRRAESTIAGVTLAQQLFAAFAVLGVLLATLGIAAVAELSVARSRHELAVRSAMGATPRQLVSSVLGASTRTAVPAAIAGAAAAWLTVDALQSILQDSAVIGVGHLVLAPVLLLACALLATALPALRTTRIQPLPLLQGR